MSARGCIAVLLLILGSLDVSFAFRNPSTVRRHANRHARTQHDHSLDASAAETPESSEFPPAASASAPQPEETTTPAYIPPLVQNNHITLQHYEKLKAAAPRIYVYNLQESKGPNCVSRGSYSLASDLEEMLLNNNLAVSSPSDADFLFVPANFYCSTHGEWVKKYPPGTPPWNYTTAHVDLVLQELRKLGPWWDDAPQKHIFAFSADHGFCGFGPGEPGSPQVRNAVILSHWGLTKRETDGRNGPIRRGSLCHVPGKDIVVPIANDFLSMVDMTPGKAADDPKRTTLLFFAGNSGVVRHSGHGTGTHYSHGTRGMIFMMFNDTAKFPRMIIQPRADDSNFKTSIFCLAPTGGGFGNRLFISMYNGCIPVIIQDDVRQPYEEILPYKKFAFILKSHKMARLRVYLGQAEAQKERYFEAVRQHRKSLWWEFDSKVGDYEGEALLRLFENLHLRKNLPKEQPDCSEHPDDLFLDSVVQREY